MRAGGTKAFDCETDSPQAMGFDMAVIPYSRWEQLKDDNAKREFLLENLPQQAWKTGNMK